LTLSDEERNQQLKIIQEIAEKLGSHFDSIQIVATFDMGNSGTSIFNWGKGNWFARYGSVKAWIQNEENAGVFTDKDADNEEEE